MLTFHKVSLACFFCALVTLAVGCGTDATPPAASIPADDEPAGFPAGRNVGAVEALPRVAIVTSLGELTVELDRVHAPLSVNNFLSYVEQKRYDGSIVHQVEPGYVALAGCYLADATKIASDFPVRNEADAGLKNLRGTIAMSRPADAIDGATTQFFFNLADNAGLDYRGNSADEYGYAVFGRVVAGLDALERISAAELVDRDGFTHAPRTPIVIESIRSVK